MEEIVRDSNQLRTTCTERPTGQHRLAPHPFSFPTSRVKVIVDLPLAGFRESLFHSQKSGELIHFLVTEMRPHAAASFAFRSLGMSGGTSPLTKRA